IISSGEIVADGKPDDLMARETTGTYRVLFEAGAEGISAKLGALDGVTKIVEDKSETGTQQFLVYGEGKVDLRRLIFRAAVDNGWPLLELDRREASLEQVFRRLTGNEERKAA